MNDTERIASLEREVELLQQIIKLKDKLAVKPVEVPYIPLVVYPSYPTYPPYDPWRKPCYWETTITSSGAIC